MRTVLCLAIFILMISPVLAQPADVLLPNPTLKEPFASETPIVLVSRSSNAAEWAKLTQYWNEGTEDTVDPKTGNKVTRKVVKIKVPLGLANGPAVPAENPMTVAKWSLGKKLYFDPILSTDNTVSCSTCHNPTKGFTDQSTVSVGIKGEKGGINAPTVLNSAYNRLQFWDGRAESLEAQAQGPPGNPKEMFAGNTDPWTEAVKRIRGNAEYVKQFESVFGHAPTRDAAAKAIATYERTVLSGNSIYDRAEVAMRKRVTDEESGKFEFKPEDFTKVLKEARAAKDTNALTALGSPENDEVTGKKLANGRTVFFGKARCSNCHVGDNFTDNAFHNLGVGAKEQKLPESEYGRFAAQPLGHKDPAQVGAFKTSGLRALLSTGPYLHDGSEKTLEAVVDFYDRGGNLNLYLDPKMRDEAGELAVNKLLASGAQVKLGKNAMKTPDNKVIIAMELKLTKEEKEDLVLFLKALQGDAPDATVADPTWFPKK